MPPDNVASLAELIRTERPLLMAGAGASALVGYPLWTPFVRQLAQTFAPQINDFGDVLTVADQIAAAASANGQRDQYLKALHDAFRPEKRTQDLRFHRNLVSLGCSGLVTTNYDLTIEHACNQAFNRPDGIPCEAIDLQDADRRFMTFQFLRKVGTNASRGQVLHLHGVYNAARYMVLGKQSYEDAYGQAEAVVERELRTFHRRVLFALLSTRPVLFVGFSLRDEFFSALLQVLEQDFVLTEEPAHFAILPYDCNPPDGATPEEVREAHAQAQEDIKKNLRGWVVPICYHAPGGNHAALPRLVEDVGAALGTIEKRLSAVDRLADRTLEEL